jgi:hypothetical protein
LLAPEEKTMPEETNKKVEATREQYLIARALISGVLAADTLFSTDGRSREPCNVAGYLETVVALVRAEVSDRQLENFEAVAWKCLSDTAPRPR